MFDRQLRCPTIRLAPCSACRARSCAARSPSCSSLKQGPSFSTLVPPSAGAAVPGGIDGPARLATGCWARCQCLGKGRCWACRSLRRHFPPSGRLVVAAAASAPSEFGWRVDECRESIFRSVATVPVAGFPALRRAPLRCARLPPTAGADRQAAIRGRRIAAAASQVGPRQERNPGCCASSRT